MLYIGVCVVFDAVMWMAKLRLYKAEEEDFGECNVREMLRRRHRRPKPLLKP